MDKNNLSRGPSLLEDRKSGGTRHGCRLGTHHLVTGPTARDGIRLMQMFPLSGITEADRDEFNRQMSDEYNFIRDFIIMHYHVTERTDTEFWRHCKNMDIPDSLDHRLRLFKDSGRVFQGEGDVFGENSWTQVMLGQGLTPEQYHPIVNMMSDNELERFLKGNKASVDNTLKQLPTHQQFIAQYCPAKPI